MTFLASVAVLSLIAAVSITMINRGANRSPIPESIPTPTNYTPEEYDSLTVLLILDDELSKTPYTFLLLRFNPSSGKIPVLLIPSQSLMDDAGEKLLLSDMQLKKGALESKMLIESNLGILIDRYMKISSNDFSQALDADGGIEYNLPSDIKLQSPVGEITINSGLQILDSKKLSSILNIGANDPSQNQLANELFCTLINSRLLTFSPSSAESFFTSILNLSDTDLSYVDIEARKRPARFLKDLMVEPAEPISVSGSLNQAGNTFSLDDETIKRVREAY